MSNEVFTILDVLPAQPPVRFNKPWFARGWVLGVGYAMAATLALAYFFGFSLNIPIFFMVVAGILWLIALVKYFKGIRYIELYHDMVLVYALNPVKPVAQIPFERMTVVQDVDEIFFIPKKQFTGGFSLKRAYWKQDWDQICTLFNNNAAYVRRNDAHGRGGFDPSPLPLPTYGSKHRSGFGIISAAVIMFEWVVALILWIPYRIQSKNNRAGNNERLY